LGSNGAVMERVP